MASDIFRNAKRRYEKDGLITVLQYAILYFLEIFPLLGERLYHVTEFFGDELSTSYRLEVPFLRRIQYYRRGFRSSSIVLYDFVGNEVDEYLSFYQTRRAWEINDVRITDHKLAFDRLLRDNFEQELPTILGVLRRSSVVAPDGRYIGNNGEDWVVDQASTERQLVLKPENGYGGEGVVLLNRTEDAIELNGSRVTRGDITDHVDGSTPYIVTEYVQQADYGANIFPDSTNTIRILTLWDYEHDEPFIADAIHRFGVDESTPVDNWDKGGLSVGINLDTGELQKGTRSPSSTTVNWYSHHPDTGAQIEGVTIPYWDDITQSVCEMAEEMWYLPLVAWDITPTEQGFKVIEANSRPTLNMMQVHRPLLSDERTRRFFQHHGVID